MSAVEFSESIKGDGEAADDFAALLRKWRAQPGAGLIESSVPNGNDPTMSDRLTATNTTAPTGDAFWPSLHGTQPELPAPQTLRPKDALRRQRVHEAVIDMHAAGKLVTRTTLAQILAVTTGRVDEHIKALHRDGLLRRVNPGVYEPVTPYPSTRAVSMTKLPDGMVKLEVGDICLDLTPNEGRAIASMLLGAAFDFSLLNSSHDLAEQISELRASEHVQKRRIAQLVEMMEAGIAQGRKSRGHKATHPT